MNNITTDYPLTVSVTNPYSETSSKSLTLRLLTTSVLMGNTASNGTTAVAYAFPTMTGITNSPITGSPAAWVAASPDANKLILRVGANEKTYNLADLSFAGLVASSNVFTELYKNFAYSLTTSTLSRIGQSTASLDISSNIGTGETLHVSQDGTMVAAAGTTGTAVVNTADMTLRRAVTTYSQFPSVSTDNACVAVGSNTTAAGIYRLADGARMLSLSQKQLPCYSANGTKVAFASSAEDPTPTVAIYNTSTNVLITTLSLPTRATSLQFFQNDYLVVGQGSSSAPIRVYNVADWSLATLPSISAAGVVPTNIVIMGNSTITTVVLDAYTKLLMHFNDTAPGNSAFMVDRAGHTVTQGGALACSTAFQHNPLNASGSATFAAYTDRISLAGGPEWLLTGNFTLEFWYYYTSGAAETCLFLQYPGSGSLWFQLNIKNNQYGIYANTAANAQYFPVTISTGAWHHAALVRSGGVMTMYHDGSQVGSTYSNSGTLGFNTTAYIGTNPWNPNTFYGAIEEARLSKVARYSGAFAPPSVPLVYDDNTIMLLQANQGFADFKGHEVKAIGAPLSTSLISHSPAAGYFNGTTDYIEVAGTSELTFAGDFTVEGWFRIIPAEALMLFSNSGTWSTNGGYIGIAFHKDALSGFATSLYAANYSTAVRAIFGDARSIVAADQWTHIALVRSSGVIVYYINGVPGVTCSYSGSMAWAPPGGYMRIGNSTSGYIDEVCMSNVARYTAAFTPPNNAFVVDSNTKLLMHFDGVQDSTTIVEEKGLAFTVAGTPKIKRNDVLLNSAVYFNGSTDRLKIPASADMICTGDFTLDLWVNVSATQRPATAVIASAVSPWGAGCWGLLLSNQASRILNLYIYNANPASFILASTSSLPGAWRHLAVVRSGGVIKLYVNGVNEGGSYSYSGAVDFNAAGIDVAYMTCNLTDSLYNGYVEELRISNTARWTSNFTPPTIAYTS